MTLVEADTEVITLPTDAQAISEGAYYDEAAAARVIAFFKKFLRHSKGKWKGKAFVPLPWQRDYLNALFGWKRADGTRRYRRSYIEIPKKNGKSTLLAGLGIYLLIADGEAGAEVYLAASDREQAGIIYREAAAMVRGNPALAKKIECIDSRKTLAYKEANSFLRALSADAYRQEGINASAVLFDELHAQKSRDMWDTLQDAGAARTQPLHISITTAGYDRHSVCYEQHKLAVAVRDGVIPDTSFLPVLFCYEEGDRWDDPEVWHRTNPSLGSTITEQSFLEDFQRAKNTPSEENGWRRRRICQWTEAETRWLSLDQWNACDLSAPTRAEWEKSLEGRRCWAGLDLSSVRDLTALTLVFPLDDGAFAVLQFSWVPAESIAERVRKDHVPYDVWCRQGWITQTDGNCVDQARIRKTTNELGKRYSIQEIAIDPYNAPR